MGAEWCKVSYAVALREARKCAHLAPPSRARSTVIGIATNPLSSLPAFVDAISHPTRPHFRSQQWVSYDSAFGPRVYIRSSCVSSRVHFPFNFLPLPMLLLPRTFAVFNVARSARTFTFSFDILGSPFS